MIWGPTDGPTDQRDMGTNGRTNGPTNIVSYRGATLCLKIVLGLDGQKILQNLQEVNFQFYAQKTAKTTTSWAA